MNSADTGKVHIQLYLTTLPRIQDRAQQQFSKGRLVVCRAKPERRPSELIVLRTVLYQQEILGVAPTEGDSREKGKPSMQGKRDASTVSSDVSLSKQRVWGWGGVHRP